MEDRTNDIRMTFSDNCRSIQKLTNLDRTIQKLVLGQLESMNAVLVKAPHFIDNDKLNGRRLIQLVESLRDSDSLRMHFQEVTNQAVVLLVSYFASSISDIFRMCILEGLKNGASSNIMKEDFKTNLGELQALSEDFNDSAPDFFLAKHDVSFQDMGSISREFRKYFSIAIRRTHIVDDIIAGQACRHAIVHAGAKASTKTIGQLKAAPNRRIKMNIKVGERVDFTSSELEIVQSSMQEYVDNLIGLVLESRASA